VALLQKMTCNSRHRMGLCHPVVDVGEYGGGVYTGPIGCLKLWVSFRKRATNYRALLREMTYKDKASYESSLPCSRYRHIWWWHHHISLLIGCLKLQVIFQRAIRCLKLHVIFRKRATNYMALSRKMTWWWHHLISLPTPPYWPVHIADTTTFT